jgi:hypothetical protein
VPSCGTLDKEFLKKKLLCRVPSGGTLGKVPVNVISPQKTLGKEVFADEFFAVYSLSSVFMALPSVLDTRQCT